VSGVARGRWRALRCALTVLCLAVTAAFAQAPTASAPEPAAPESPSAQLVVHILDYLAVDYGGAVKDGKAADEGEYREQLDFVAQARELIARLAPRPERTDLAAQVDRLVGLVRDKASAAQVAAQAGELRWAVIRAYGVDVAPKRPPDLRVGAALYASNCGVCHGAEGRGDGPGAAGLDPKPRDFHDRDRMAQLSLYSLYSTIALGVRGTAMVGFPALSDDQRWALASYVAGLGDSAAERQRGMALWKAGKGREAFGDLASIATRSERELEARHGADAPALLAFLRAEPDALAATGNVALHTSLRLLRESREAYRAGRTREAQDLAVSSYLDGFELAEASLDAVDHRLRAEGEADMLRYRALIRDGAPLPDVEAQAAKIEALLGRARGALEVGGLSPGTAFASAFIILLREGLEAFLVVAALIAILVKGGRRDVLPWVHGGWIAALLLGAATWWIASYAVSVSGATRETTEGVTAFLAAAVLLYVGFWMHGKSQAQRWQQFLEHRLSGALSAKTMGALALVSFLAVYREVFETVLFYQALAAQAGPDAAWPLLAGFGVAALTLLVLGWIIVRSSLSMPLGLFFGVSSILIGLLAVVFAGKGVAALQEAGVLPIHGVALPSLPLVGVYPNIEGLVVQAVLLVIVAVGFAWTSRVSRSAA
jgi:high-affinity iron transporter